MGREWNDRVLGTLYGLAIGDALGMPSELWPRARVREHFGEIRTFLDGPEENEVAKYYEAGQFTDDTAQALVVLDSLQATDFEPDASDLACRLIAWGEEMDAFNREIFGPSSLSALKQWVAGAEPSEIRTVTDRAVTNGSAMRIAPIGLFYSPDEERELLDLIEKITIVTHSSDVTLSGAAMIAGAVSASVAGFDRWSVLSFALNLGEKMSSRGAATYSASLTERTRWAVRLANRYQGRDELFSEKLYDIIGSGTLITESVPSALALAFYSGSVSQCARLAANFGGDTDTIGAMATAICGAREGFSAIRPDWVETIDAANDVNLHDYADLIVGARRS